MHSQTCCSGGVPISTKLGFQSTQKCTLHLAASVDGISFTPCIMNLLYWSSITDKEKHAVFYCDPDITSRIS